eukprot:GHRR01026088.1.p1 GENE.GHRR01026088.1~~GHRR01026088.1.p1  ORF type:complete len:146 (-),score=11.04 GHRR01026088.1:155-592(-)
MPVLLTLILRKSEIASSMNLTSSAVAVGLSVTSQPWSVVPATIWPWKGSINTTRPSCTIQHIRYFKSAVIIKVMSLQAYLSIPSGSSCTDFLLLLPGLGSIYLTCTVSTQYNMCCTMFPKYYLTMDCNDKLCRQYKYGNGWCGTC